MKPSGCFEKIKFNDLGNVSISGWSICDKFSIQINDTESNELVMQFSLRPDRNRKDLDRIGALEFSLDLDASIVSLLPARFEIKAMCNDIFFGYYKCEPNLTVGGGLVEVLKKKLDDGMVWNRKSGKLHLPINKWSENRINSTLKLVGDLFEVTNGRVLAGYGTLLGLVRDSELIPWDDDVDVMLVTCGDSFEDFVKNYVDTLRAIRETMPVNFAFFEDFAHLGVHYQDGSVDLWPVWENSNGEILDIAGVFRPENSDTDIIGFKGFEVPIPKSFKDYLIHSYGTSYLSPNDSWRPQRYVETTANTISGGKFRSTLNLLMLKHVKV